MGQAEPIHFQDPGTYGAYFHPVIYSSVMYLITGMDLDTPTIVHDGYLSTTFIKHSPT